MEIELQRRRATQRDCEVPEGVGYFEKGRREDAEEDPWTVRSNRVYLTSRAETAHRVAPRSEEAMASHDGTGHKITHKLARRVLRHCETAAGGAGGGGGSNQVGV